VTSVIDWEELTALHCIALHCMQSRECCSTPHATLTISLTSLLLLLLLLLLRLLQVATLVEADYLFLLTDVDALYTANPKVGIACHPRRLAGGAA
jgi:hypothetical protein